MMGQNGGAEQPDWIAVDWGTSNLRAYAMAHTAQGQAVVLASAESGDGMAGLARSAFEPALLALVAPWLPAGRARAMPIIACGMVGSRQGWHEAPYRTVPCTPLDAGTMVRVPAHDPRIEVWIAPGLKQTSAADVMRGEETQIAGALALHPNFDGVICLPGTHSKWCRISAGEVVGFQTYLTGEMFALLSHHSVLRHGMQGDSWDDASFDDGLITGISQPGQMLAQLFRLRAEGLIAGLPAGAARARLSGLLIGSELAATTAWWQGQPILLIGTDHVAALYARALAQQGAQAQVLPAADCTIKGLAHCAKQI